MKWLGFLSMLAISIAAAPSAESAVGATFLRSWAVGAPMEELALGPDGKSWVFSHWDSRLEIHAPDGTLLRAINVGYGGLTSHNAHTTFLSNGDAVVADGSRLLHLTSSGDFIEAWPVTLDWCLGITVDDAGFVYALSSSSNSLTVIKFDTNSESVVDTWPLAHAGQGIAYSAGVIVIGNTFPFGVSDPRMEIRSTSGVIMGDVRQPFREYTQGMTADAAGRVYFPNSRRNFVAITDLTGAVIGYAGNPTYAPLPEGRMSGPLGVAVDAGGTLLVSDSGNNRVLEYSISDITPATATTWGRLKVLYR